MVGGGFVCGLLLCVEFGGESVEFVCLGGEVFFVMCG